VARIRRRGCAEQQEVWRFDDLAAHNMAVLAMAQMAIMMQGTVPTLALATSDSICAAPCRQRVCGVVAVRSAARASRHADQLGRDLGQPRGVAGDRLNAEGLVLVKACAIEPSMDVVEVGRGNVDHDSPASRATPLMRELLNCAETAARARAFAQWWRDGLSPAATLDQPRASDRHGESVES